MSSDVVGIEKWQRWLVVARDVALFHRLALHDKLQGFVSACHLCVLAAFSHGFWPTFLSDGGCVSQLALRNGVIGAQVRLFKG